MKKEEEKSEEFFANTIREILAKSDLSTASLVKETPFIKEGQAMKFYKIYIDDSSYSQAVFLGMNFQLNMEDIIGDTADSKISFKPLNLYSKESAFRVEVKKTTKEVEISEGAMMYLAGIALQYNLTIDCVLNKCVYLTYSKYKKIQSN